MLPMITAMPRRKRHKLPFTVVKLPASLSSTLLLVVGFTAGYLFYEAQAPKVFSSATSNPQLQVCFSPEGNCEKLVITAIQSAKKQILVQAYAFTSDLIAKALIEAHRRGINVRLLYDQSQANTPHSKVPLLQQAGIATKADPATGLAHNKVMIIDDFLLTGSFNFTKAANTKNAENLLLIQDKALVRIYEENWQRRYPGDTN